MGHGFAHRKKCAARLKQGLKILRDNARPRESRLRCFVSGHDFSRALIQSMSDVG
jgi:hypothetical protein